MCTLILWYRAFDGIPIIVAANRDEVLDRPSAPPGVRLLSRRSVLCPTDLLAGGTWLGINDRRLFAAITNRYGVKKHEDRRSRGQLVLQALDHDDADSATKAIAALNPARENAFHLVIADENSAHLVICDGTEMTLRRLESGLHVITERSFGEVLTAREHRIHARLDPITEPPSDALLTTLLATHDEVGFEGICVHVPALNYGTRSSTILRVAQREIRLQFADGPPHETTYERIVTNPRL